MKAIIQKQALLEAINVVQKAVMAKATLPVLEGIYIQAGEKLTLIGNCFELAIEYKVDADIRETGSIVLNARMFGEIIRRLPDAEVSIEVHDNHKVRIECLNARFDIKGMDSEGFPLPPEYEESCVFTLTQSTLKDMIRQTNFAVSSDENRKIMTGTLFETGNGELSLVALDGFRMAISHTLIKQEVATRVVIPGKSMNEIHKILESSDEEICITHAGSLVAFSMANCRIISKTIEGEFMNYKGYIPAQFETTITAGRREMEECLERAALISSDDKRYPVRFSIQEDSITIQSSAEIGESKESLVIKQEGTNLTIGFNPKFFLDALKVSGEDQIRISFTSQVGPCIITPLEGKKFLFLILPVRIKA